MERGYDHLRTQEKQKDQVMGILTPWWRARVMEASQAWPRQEARAKMISLSWQHRNLQSFMVLNE